VGYSWDITDAFNISLGYTRLFYRDSSSVLFTRKITSVITESNVDITGNYIDSPKNKLGLDIGWDILSVVDLLVTAEYTFGTGYDFNSSIGLSHRFVFKELLFSNDLSFTPGISAYVGLLYGYKKGKVKKNGTLIEVEILKNTTGVAIYDYSLSLPLSYSIGDFSIAPALTIDFQAGSGSSKKNDTSSSERTASFSLSLSYLL